MRSRRHPRRVDRAADAGGDRALRVALFGARARPDRGRHVAMGWRQPGAHRLRAAGVCARLPSADSAAGLGLSSGSVRITTGTNRRLRLFAVTQIAASFVLLAGAGALLATLIALQQTKAGVNLRNVLAVHVPLNFERPPEQTLPLYREAFARSASCPASNRSPSARSCRGAKPARSSTRSSLPRATQGGWRGRSARELPHRVAGILQVAGRADHRRPRLQRRRSFRQREGRDHQRERGAADVQQPGRASTAS